MTGRTFAPAVPPQLLLLLICVASTFANAQVSPSTTTQPASPAISNKQATSLGNFLQRPGKEPLHILYMHGIGATGPGGSQLLRDSICTHVKKFVKEECVLQPDTKPTREYADADIFAIHGPVPNLAYMGAPVWTKESWPAAAPFVDHYIIKLKSGKSILIDELNWWPLVLAFKCQHLIPNETNLAGKLSGKNNNYLRMCHQLTPHVGDNVTDRFDSYDWLAQPRFDFRSLDKTPNRAALLNRWLKVFFLDWSLADAALAIGPLEDYLVEGIRQLLVKCVQTGSATTTMLTGQSTPPLDPNAKYFTVTHSLGSFLMFSALHTEYKAKSYDRERMEVFNHILGHLHQAYFFANQIPLLELGKLGTTKTKSFLDLEAWSKERMLVDRVTAADDSRPLAQIVSWSDPSDLLTFYLGDDFKYWQAKSGRGIRVVNNVVKNATRWNWLWLAENPGAAHDNYAKNPAVIEALLKPIASP